MFVRPVRTRLLKIGDFEINVQHFLDLQNNSSFVVNLQPLLNLHDNT
jgi:hypothetical protein